ncbi:M1 family metallopeptidase [bacterium]|nr:M1 family metallopeptidase [bacterium]
MKRIFFLITAVIVAILPASASNFTSDPNDIFLYIDAQIAAKTTISQTFMQNSREIRDYDVQHYNLHIIPDFSTKTMAGEVEIQALSSVDALQVITLDMGDRIEPDTVLCGGNIVNSTHIGDSLEISLDQAYDIDELFTIYIAYHGTPRTWTFHFIEHNGVPIFSTMSEPEGGREWWPSNDVPWDKATVTIRTTVPDWMFVVSNGLITDDTDNGDGTHCVTWETKYLTATYLVAVSGTDYETIMFEYIPKEFDDPMPVPVYTYPELREAAENAFENTVNMIDFFSVNFGEYPFLDEKYGQVLVPNGGGMEHQTITHINAQYITPNSKPNSLIAHELAHQWWGDYITMSEWPHIWLNESFATYSDALYLEYSEGTEAFRDRMRRYASRDYNGSIYDPVFLFDAIVYTKGAFVLHMLRRTVGENTFWNILQTYYRDQRFAYSNASTAQFQEICETVSGQDLEWFFQQWIFGTKRPTIQYGWDYSPVQDGTGYVTTVTLEQIQEDLPLFKFLVDIMIETADGNVMESVWVETASHSVEIVTPAPPYQVVLDRDVWLLAYQEIHPDQFQFTTDEKLPQAHFGQIYSTILEIAGGQAPYTLELLSGDLPMGINLDLQTGEFSGFPLETGKSTFTIRAIDSRFNEMYTQKTFMIRALYPQAEIAIIPDQNTYSNGDVMTVSLSLSSKSEYSIETILYILLEIEDCFYFLDVSQDVYPYFSIDISGIDLTIPPEFDLKADFLSIPLPNPVPNLSGTWWGLLMNSETGAAAGPVSSELFEFISN